MPQNVEIARRYFEWEDLEGFTTAAADFWESDGDYYPIPGFPEARPCHGTDQIVDFLEQFLAVWDSYGYEVKEARALGDDRVLVHGHIRAEGRASGVKLESDIYHCCWLRHGRFIRIEDHLTEEGALSALG